MEKGTVAIVNLQNPREKVIGIIHEVLPAGIVIRGIDVNSFQDWAAQVAKDDSAHVICPTTMFFPMHRVIRCYEDEDMGDVPSFSTQFANRTGKLIRDLLQ
jgi:hypothetical protein